MAIDELRIYTVTAGGLPEYLRLAQEVAVPIRGDDFGKLLGFWYGEIGAVNRVFNLWQHQNLSTRQIARDALDELEPWRTQYVAKVHPLMEEQVIRLMTPIAPMASPAGSGHIYEAKIIWTRVGKAKELAVRLRDDAPQSPGVTSVGIWTTFAGHLNEVVQILAYRDLGTRLASSINHVAWRQFFDRYGQWVERIESSLMLPADHSPLR